MLGRVKFKMSGHLKAVDLNIISLVAIFMKAYLLATQEAAYAWRTKKSL